MQGPWRRRRIQNDISNGDGWHLFSLVERPVLSLTLSISLAQSHCPWSPSFLYHNDYQSSSHRQPRKKTIG